MIILICQATNGNWGVAAHAIVAVDLSKVKFVHAGAQIGRNNVRAFEFELEADLVRGEGRLPPSS